MCIRDRVYSEISDSFHVSGHGSSQETLLLMALTNPRSTVPIGGTYRQMVAYKNLAKLHGLLEEDIFLPEDGQEVVFLNGKGKLGRKIQLKTVYVDEISGAEVEQFVPVSYTHLTLPTIL